LAAAASTCPHALRVGAAQISTDSDIAANLAKIEAKLHEAAAAGVQILLFHEGCLTGYPADSAACGRIDWLLVARAEARVQELAESLGVAVLLGSNSRDDATGAVHNDVLIVDERGTALGRYSKTWRAGEPHFEAGSGPVIFTLCGVECTCLICHDLRYPELTRLGVAAGARIVFMPNNEAGLAAEDKLLGYRSMQISRATENIVYGVMCNAPQDAADMTRLNASHGNSMVVAPWGNVLDEATSFEERLVVADIDLAQATGATAARTIGGLKRYEDLYSLAPGGCEHPAYARWMRSGLSMVTRLDGSGQQLQPVPVSAPIAWPGHVHPSMCCTAGGTLVVVYAMGLYEGGNVHVLMCTRSHDFGLSWSEPAQIPCSLKRPDSILEVDPTARGGGYECYPGTCTALPDGRVLITWDYRTYGHGYHGTDIERALLYAISETDGESWGDQNLIYDPTDPPSTSVDDVQHLGWVRHIVLPWDGGQRWLLPLTKLDKHGGLPGVKIYDPSTGALEPLPVLSPGQPGAHPALRNPVKMVAQAADGSLLALGVGNSASDNPYGDSKRITPGAAPVLHSRDGVSWTEVENFPAGIECPAGVDPNDWDDDGDREGRHLCSLRGGHILATWVVAGDRSAPSTGIHYNLSVDASGAVWDPTRTVVVLPSTPVIGRYYSPRTVELSDGSVGTCFVKGPQEAMQYVAFVKVSMRILSP
jgi:predicted amidohydrolase